MTRTAILVLGMHRSGTSALAGMLARLGAASPRTLMPADDHNSLGYWESSALCDFHDRLLDSAGTAWDLWSRVDLDALEPALLDRFNLELQTLLAQEFATAPLLAIKDPRLCRLLPFWQRHLATADIAPVHVVVWRDPFEVARSLAARDAFPTKHALLLWIRHALDAERDTRGHARLFVRYDELLADWRAVADRITSTLGIEWPLARDSNACEIDSFLQQSLRHHTEGWEAPMATTVVVQWAQEVLAAHETLATGNEAHASARLDAIANEFDQVTSDISAVLADDRLRHRRRLRSTQSELNTARQHARNLEMVHGELQRALNADRDQLRQALDYAQARHLDLERDRQRLEHERTNLDDQRIGLERELETTGARLSRLEAEHSELRQAHNQLAVELATTWAETQTAGKEILALRRSLSWRLTAPLRLLGSRGAAGRTPRRADE